MNMSTHRGNLSSREPRRGHLMMMCPMAQRHLGKSIGAGSLKLSISVRITHFFPSWIFFFHNQKSRKWSRFLPAGTILIAVFECDVDPAVPSVSDPPLTPGTASHTELFSLEWSGCMGVCRVFVQ